MSMVASVFSYDLNGYSWFCKQTTAGPWMRNYGPSVQPTTCDMKLSQTKFAKRRRIRPQLVGDNFIWNVSLLFQEFPCKFKGRAFVSARLGQDLKNLAFIVNSPPQICPLATNADKDFIKMPGS